MDKKHTINDALEYIERWSENVEHLLSRCIETTEKHNITKGLPYPESDKFQSVIFPREALNKLLQSLPQLKRTTSAIRQSLAARNNQGKSNDE